MRAVWANADGPPTWWIVPGVVANDLQLNGHHMSGSVRAAADPEWSAIAEDLTYEIRISRRGEQLSYILWEKNNCEDKSQLLEIKFDDKSKHDVLEFMKGQGAQFVDGKATRETARAAKKEFMEKNASEGGGGGDGAEKTALKRPAAASKPKARAARKRPASADQDGAGVALKRPAAAQTMDSSTSKRPAAVSAVALQRPAAAPDADDDQDDSSDSDSSSDKQEPCTDASSKADTSVQIPDLPAVPRLLSELDSSADED